MVNLKTGARIMRLLASADESVLDEFDAEIARLEAALKGIRAAREVVAERVLNVPRADLKPSSNGHTKATGNNVVMLDRVAEMLRYSGPRNRSQLAREFGKPADELEELLTADGRFFKDHQWWKLSSEGEADFEAKDGKNDD